jgi:hypothetical protein
LQALTELSIADNRIQQLPADLSGLTALRKAHFYGNQLTQLPMGPDGLPALLLPGSTTGSNDGSSGGSNGSSGPPLLSSLWLEANPLTDAAVLELLELAGQITAATAAGSNGGSNGGSSSKGSKQPRIGLDDWQLSGGQVLEVWRQQQEAGCSIVRRGIIKVSQLLLWPASVQFAVAGAGGVHSDLTELVVLAPVHRAHSCIPAATLSHLMVPTTLFA